PGLGHDHLTGLGVRAQFAVALGGTVQQLPRLGDGQLIGSYVVGHARPDGLIGCCGAVRRVSTGAPRTDSAGSAASTRSTVSTATVLLQVLPVPAHPQRDARTD